MATLIELELAQNKGTVLVNPDHIVSVTEEVTLETGEPTTRVVLNIYSQVAQATGNAPFILVEESAAEVLQKMDDAAGPAVVAPDPGTGTSTGTATVDPNAPIGSIGQIVLWKLPPGKVISDLFNTTGFGIDPLTEGWAICNGENGTVDLRGRVPAGWDPDDPDFDVIGKPGGNKVHTLTMEEMPKHRHIIWGYDNTASPAPGNGFDEVSNLESDFVPGATYARRTGWEGGPAGASEGQSKAHNNLQPYRVGLFIQRISGANVIATGTASTTTSSNTGTVTEAYVDNAIATALSAALPIKIKAFGSELIGDAPADNPVTVSLGLTLPNNNYIVMVSGASTPAGHIYANNVTYAIYDKTTTSFKISFEGNNGNEQLTIEWILYQA